MIEVRGQTTITILFSSTFLEARTKKEFEKSNIFHIQGATQQQMTNIEFVSV